MLLRLLYLGMNEEPENTWVSLPKHLTGIFLMNLIKWYVLQLCSGVLKLKLTNSDTFLSLLDEAYLNSSEDK